MEMDLGPSGLEIFTEEVLKAHPELHHYTTFDGLMGIHQTQTLWATHYAHLNDFAESKTLREPLIAALRERFTPIISEAEKNDVRIAHAIAAMKGSSIGGIATDLARDLVNSLYAVGFSGNIPLEPYITSFCSHATQEYERENGLLSQWRAYGGTEGYCIVFDTRNIGYLLIEASQINYFAQLRLDAIYYHVPTLSVGDVFRDLLSQCDQMVTKLLIHEDPPDTVMGYFMNAAMLLKHRGYAEERELRIVAIPATEEVATEVRAAHPDFSPPPIIAIHQRDGWRRRYIRLFDFPKSQALPIKRVIVGPSARQEENYMRARNLLGHRTQLVKSATPFMG
jgi:hypothetical protein